MTVLSRSIAVPFFFLLLIAGVVHAEPNALESDHDVAFLRQVSTDHDNLLFVGDLLPHLERLFSSDSLREVMLHGKIKGLFGTPLDPRHALAKLDQGDRFIPTEVVAAMPARSLDQLAQFAHAGLLVGLCTGAVEVGEEQGDNDLAKLQKELLTVAKELGVPKMTVWVRFRDDAIPGMLLTLVRQGLADIEERDGVEVLNHANAFGVKATLGDLISPAQISLTLLLMGAAKDFQDPNTLKIGEALAELELEIWLERRDGGLRLTVGPRPAESVYDVDALGELWQPDRSMVAFARWNVASFRDRLSNVLDTWKAWEETPTGRATSQFDTEDILGDLKLLLRQMEQSGRSGELRLNVGDSIEAMVRTVGQAPALPLRESPLLEFVPKDAEVLILNTAGSLADHWSNRLSYFEDRLATKTLQYDLSGKTQQAELGEKATQFYYARLSDFRKLIHQESHRVFEPPVGILVASQGKIKRLGIEFDAPEDTVNRIIVEDAPMLEYAVVGRLRHPERSCQFLGQVWKSLLASFLPDPPVNLTTSKDLGLGVETYVFPGDFWQKVQGNVRVTVEGDLLPHYFVSSGWFVFSTSPRLSRKILAAKRDADRRFQLPADGNSPVIAYGRVPSTTMAAYVEYFGVFIHDFFLRRGTITLEGPVFSWPPPANISQLSSALQGMGEIIRLVDVADWQTVQESDVRKTRFQVGFTDP
jgi:hypothetical protein